MKKLNQNGAVDLIFIAVLLILLSAAGFTVWRLQQADETVSETATNTANESEVNRNSQRTEEDQIKPQVMIPDGWKEYRNSELSVAFAAPADWSHETNQIREYDPSMLDGLNSYFFSGVKSPDYKEGYVVGALTRVEGISVRFSFNLVSKVSDSNSNILSGQQTNFPNNDPEKIASVEAFSGDNHDGIKLVKSIDPDRNDVSRYIVYRFEDGSRVVQVEVDKRHLDDTDHAELVDKIVKTLSF